MQQQQLHRRWAAGVLFFAVFCTIARASQLADPVQCLSAQVESKEAYHVEDVESVEEQLAQAQRHELLQVGLSHIEAKRLQSDIGRIPVQKYGGAVPIKGISYGPAPLKQPAPLLNDDFTSEGAAALWSDHGRGDLRTMTLMGANAVRLYGNDPSFNKTAFLDTALQHGLDVIMGMSDYPYTQAPFRCSLSSFNCFDVVRASYKMNLENGLLVSGGQAYHPALKAFILLNEPELKMPYDLWCRAIISAFDGVLEAEREMGVSKNLVAFTTSFSFGIFSNKAPALGQMEDLYTCMNNPEAAPTAYTPKNDVLVAYRSRFVNSFNTANPSESLREMFLVPYKSSSFWTDYLKMPVMILEYHSPYVPVMSDLESILRISNSEEYPYFLGLSFFEFTVRYDKGGAEMDFGMFGYGSCDVAKLHFAGENMTAWNLVARKDSTGASMPEGVAFAYNGEVPDLACEATVLAEEDVDGSGSARIAST